MSDGSRSSRSSVGFLAMCFAIVGLVGVFAAFATQVPLHRAIARDAALDDALIALHGPDPMVALEALRPRLDDSAPAVIPPPANPEAAIAGERVAMRKRFVTEADATSRRMNLMIGIVTVMAFVFGAAITGLARR